MPDASGNIKGISMFGLKNAWLEEVEMRKRLAKRHEEEQSLYDRLADPCPRDTNGDGDCGRRYCPHCGER